MLDVGWLVFLGLIAGGSLAVSMIISNRYEAVVFAITAGFFFTILSLTVLAGEDWGVTQEITHDYSYIVANSNYVQIEHIDFSTEDVLQGWSIFQCGKCDLSTSLKYRKANQDIRFSTEAHSIINDDSLAQINKTITVDGTITKISGTLEIYQKMRPNESRWWINVTSDNWQSPGTYQYYSTVYKNKVNWEIEIPTFQKSGKVELEFRRDAGTIEPDCPLCRSDPIQAVTLFDIEAIAIEHKPTPPAQIDFITETHGTVWLHAWPQMQMAISTFLGLIGLWAFFYAICVAFQFGPGRTKQ